MLAVAAVALIPALEALVVPVAAAQAAAHQVAQERLVPLILAVVVAVAAAQALVQRQQAAPAS